MFGQPASSHTVSRLLARLDGADEAHGEAAEKAAAAAENDVRQPAGDQADDNPRDDAHGSFPLSLVVTGLVPATPIRMARPCPLKRDGRGKLGHDTEIAMRSSAANDFPASNWKSPALPRSYRRQCRRTTASTGSVRRCPAACRG